MRMAKTQGQPPGEMVGCKTKVVKPGAVYE